MSNETEEMPMGTKPVEEHKWLQQMVGEWTTEAEMMTPNGEMAKGTGTETVTDLGGLWAFSDGRGEMPNGETMDYKAAIGYDVSFKEYRGCWFASMSSHLWKYTGTMSEDKKKLTLDCVGPHMMKDGETANYRDVHEIIDESNRTMTSFGQDDEGNWQQFMLVKYTRR